jgi:hypothetical protein
MFAQSRNSATINETPKTKIVFVKPDSVSKFCGMLVKNSSAASRIAGFPIVCCSLLHFFNSPFYLALMLSRFGEVIFSCRICWSRGWSAVPKTKEPGSDTSLLDRESACFAVAVGIDCPIIGKQRRAYWDFRG